MFDPRVYAVSGLAPSLGDLLLNGLLALLLAGAGVVCYRHYRLPTRAQLAPVGAGACPRCWACWPTIVGLYSYYTSAFSNTQLTLDITQSIQVQWLSAGAAAGGAAAHGGLHHGLLPLDRLLAPDLRRLPCQPVLLVGLLLAAGLLGLGAILHEVLLLLPGMACLYLVLLRIGNLHWRPEKGPPRYLLLLLLLGLASAISASALYGQFERQLLLDKQRLATNLLIDNDLQGEFLLGQRLK
ncbi:MAG: hypothetical protein WKG07_15825 [Hymenobacter sp.]